MVSLVFMVGLYGKNECHLQSKGAVGWGQTQYKLAAQASFLYLPGGSEVVYLKSFLQQDNQQFICLVHALHITS